MKRNKDGNLEMDLETYKMILEDIVSGREEAEWGATLKPETIQKAKAKLKEIEKLEANNIQ